MSLGCLHTGPCGEYLSLCQTARGELEMTREKVRLLQVETLRAQEAAKSAAHSLRAERVLSEAG